MNANIILPKTETCVIITARNLYINSTHFVNFYNQNWEMSNEISNLSLVPTRKPIPKKKKILPCVVFLLYPLKNS